MSARPLSLAPAILAIAALAAPALAALPPITLRGGLSIASVSGRTGVFEPKSKLGVMGGLDVAFPLSAGLSVSPEAGFALRGFSYGESEFADQDGNLRGTFETLASTTVVTFATPLRLALAGTGPLGLELLGGPAVGFESREDFVTTGASEGSIRSDALRGGDFGLIAGITATVPAGPGRWGLEARYVYGLTRLWRASTLDAATRAIEIATVFTPNPKR